MDLVARFVSGMPGTNAPSVPTAGFCGERANCPNSLEGECGTSLACGQSSADKCPGGGQVSGVLSRHVWSRERLSPRSCSCLLRLDGVSRADSVRVAAGTRRAVWVGMSIDTIRESAVSNGMVVAKSERYRLVCYRQAADGSWVGVWFAAVSRRAAVAQLMRATGTGEVAELWHRGKPLVTVPANDNALP